MSITKMYTPTKTLLSGEHPRLPNILRTAETLWFPYLNLVNIY